MKSVTLSDEERIRLAGMVGCVVEFKARNFKAARWQKAFLRTLHLNKDGDWVTLKYVSGEYTGDTSCLIIRRFRRSQQKREGAGMTSKAVVWAIGFGGRIAHAWDQVGIYATHFRARCNPRLTYGNGWNASGQPRCHKCEKLASDQTQVPRKGEA